MERMTEQEPPQEKDLVERLVPAEEGRRSIRSRWLLCCMLPAAGVVSVAATVISVYAALRLNEQAARTILFAWAAGIAVLLALWLVCGQFINSIAQQLRLLQGQALRMTERNFGVKTEKTWDDELGDLTDSLNTLDDEIARDRAVQSEFISSVSHELRTPLTAITGWAEALSFDEAIQGDSRRGISIIEKESGRLTKMVAELLDFTRIQDGRFNLNLETVDLPSEVEDAMFTYRSLMEQEGIQLHYDCDEESIPTLEGDPERLKQVLLNVLDNAAKYGKDGETIEISVTAEDRFVVLRVRDHGPGIPEEELPHVKERFYKGSSKERGSGIGLAVCEEIVVRHGGALEIENAPEGGVLVTVRLPQKQYTEGKKENAHTKK